MFKNNTDNSFKDLGMLATRHSLIGVLDHSQVLNTIGTWAAIQLNAIKTNVSLSVNWNRMLRRQVATGFTMVEVIPV